jgi:dihydroneopterin triphosphate diphosphatase
MPDDAAFRRPESVLVLVYTRSGDVLLLQRRKPLDFWQSVTGSLEPGELHADAAARELAEETGLLADDRLTFSGTRRVFEIDPRWQSRYGPGVTHNIEYEWHYCLEEMPVVQLDEAEHSAYRWIQAAEAQDLVWSWTNRSALRSLNSFLIGTTCI